MNDSPFSRRVRTLVACVAVVLGVLVTLEVGLRVEGAFRDAEIDRGLRAMRRRAPPPAGASVALEDIVQLSVDPRIVYELIPGLSVKFIVPLTTNSAGFRSAEIPERKPPRTVRVLGLGDSVMFGWAVRDGEDFLSVTVKELARRHPEVAWEAINTAVPGYNAVMEVETLVAKGLRFEPDLVVLNLVGNDSDLPNFIRRRSEPLSLARSFLAERVRSLSEPRPRADTPDGLGNAPWVRGGFARDPGTVPPEYRDMVGVDAAKRALTELRDVTRARRIALIWVGHPELDGDARRIARRWGIETVSSKRTIDRYAREHRIADPSGPPLSVSKRDPHPTPVGHRLIAEAIVERLESSGLAAALVEKAVTGGMALSASGAGGKVTPAEPPSAATSAP